MSETIDQYGLIGDLGTAALISARGNLAWLCWPNFDSQACFASLLGTEAHGRWLLSPKSARTHSRRYLPGTLVLETTHTQGPGHSVRITDFMPIRDRNSSVVRIVRGHEGRIRVQTHFAPRFDYGTAQPRIEPRDGYWTAVTGPHRLVLRSNVKLEARKGDLEADWLVKAGETYYFTLQHNCSYSEPEPVPLDAKQAERETVAYWQKWISQNTYQGPYQQAVERSLLTLKALTFAASGGFVAAPTTSLPEKVGGIRNWDYRFCWLRDATFSLLSFLHCGFKQDAKAWVEWLSRAVQGSPQVLKTMYGISGQREHGEWEAGWLPGYRRSSPVHIGNRASGKLQLDIFGEVLDALYRARCQGVYPDGNKSGQALEFPILEHLEHVWNEPDEGLWEIRHNARHYTESKVMAWVAFDRGIRMAEKFDLPGPLARWRKTRAKIHAQVCARGFHKKLNSFTQAYGTGHLDSSLLLLPLVGFLPTDDARVTGTVKAIEKRLRPRGLILRYDTYRVKDNLPPGEGAFLACNFWLVAVYVMQGRRKDAQALFEKLLGLSNDLHLLSEEYDPEDGLVGNFPQAFSHVALIQAALALEQGRPPILHELY